jgi:hypothetical protein
MLQKSNGTDQHPIVLPNFGPGVAFATPNFAPMFRTTLLLLTLSAITTLSAQNEALTTLAGSGSQQWSVIGGSGAEPCKAGDASYTFQAKPAQVVVKQCAGGTWKSSTETITTWAANGKSGIAFGGAKYEVKTLPSTAPACKGSGNCVRLVTVPDGKTDATRTIYLSR